MAFGLLEEMMTEFEQQICELYDANPSRQQITNLAKMYQVPEDHIKEVLQSYGRVIPLAKKGPKPRAVVLNRRQQCFGERNRGGSHPRLRPWCYHWHANLW